MIDTTFQAQMVHLVNRHLNLLDPRNTGITLKTIAKAAAVLGGQIRVQV
ncbi:MAG: hypothetical protein Q9M14_06790 [Mariprofundaceae bacterium]|nr:hypothetical protein [Mariprofundaceae bacterium]